MTAEIAWEFVGAVPAAWWTQWDGLNECWHDSHPVLSSLMLRPLVESFATSSLLYATGRRGSQVVAMALLTRASANRWTVFSPSQAPLSAVLSERTTPLETLARSLLRALPGMGLALDVPARDPHLRGEKLTATMCAQSSALGTTISVGSDAGFDSYWESRSKDLRKNLKRYFNRAADAALPVRLQEISDPREIGAAVERYGMLESSGWKGREGTALHPQNAQGSLYRRIMEGFAAANSASVYELHVGDRLAASRLIVRGPKMHVILKTTYSEDLKQFAPGRMLLHLILQQLLGKGVPVEFYTRANDDLLSWATAKRELFATTVFRNEAVVVAASARRLLRHWLRARPKPAQETDTAPSNVASPSAAAPRE